MAAWGPKLYQDDIAEDVRSYYKEQLHYGKTGVEITQELLKQYEYLLEDMDDAPVFWFALADTQWSLGRLEDVVKEKALYHIREGNDIKRWKSESPKEAKIREKVLLELEQKLLSPQPEEKKVSKYRLYHCEWKVGDVFAYQLSSEYGREKGYVGKYLYFVKVDESSWYPGHIVPRVYFYWTISESILSLDELVNLDYIPQFYKPTVYKDKPNKQVEYLLTLLNTSSRVIPKKQLTYIGNVGNVRRMDNESLESYKTEWRNFEEYIINNFEIWNEFRVNDDKCI